MCYGAYLSYYRFLSLLFKGSGCCFGDVDIEDIEGQRAHVVEQLKDGGAVVLLGLDESFKG